jgi:hypothetical protein
MAMHSREFAEATMTPGGDKGLEIGAMSMAMVTVEILANPQALAEIKKEFEEKRL